MNAQLNIEDLDNRLLKRALLKGEFRGRTVVVLMQRGQDSPGIVVSMETHATRPMGAYEFAEYRADRDAERALFALEAKHELGLKHENACLRATWGGDWRFEFGPTLELQRRGDTDADRRQELYAESLRLRPRTTCPPDADLLLSQGGTLVAPPYAIAYGGRCGRGSIA